MLEYVRQLPGDAIVRGKRARYGLTERLDDGTKVLLVVVLVNPKKEKWKMPPKNTFREVARQFGLHFDPHVRFAENAIEFVNLIPRLQVFATAHERQVSLGF